MFDQHVSVAFVITDNATRSGTVNRPLEMITAQLEESLGPEEEPPISSWRFVMRVDGGGFGRLVSVSDDGATATVRFSSAFLRRNLARILYLVLTSV